MHGDVATKAAGLLDRFREGTTILGLKMCLKVFGLLEELNRSCQYASGTVSGMLEAVEKVSDELMKLRTNEQFQLLYDDVSAFVTEHHLEPISLPRQRRPPKRISGTGEAHVAQTAEDHFRPIYFTVLDTAYQQLRQRLNKNTPGMETYLALEKMLLFGELDVTLCSTYPELDARSLQIQLQMLHNSYTISSLHGTHEIFRGMKPEVRALFCAVEQLMRLMLICPLSSCNAERSFSALRRLKTWLRTTMTEARLNACNVCHVNKDILDTADIAALAAEFARRSDIRVGTFGSF